MGMHGRGMASGQHPPDDDDATISDDEWPVAEQYRVEPRPETLPPVEDDATIVLQQDAAPEEPVRRFPPDLGPGLLLALLGVLLLLVLIPGGIWLAGRDTDEPEAAPITDTVTTTTTTTTEPAATTPDAQTVPDLTGRTLAEARALVEQEGARVRVRRVPSDAPVGRVLEQSPAAGTRLTSDTVVVLTVANRSTPERVTVPSVEGLQAGEAAAILRRAGLQLRLRTIRSSEPEGVVVGQEPEADEEVAPRTVVVLEVAGPQQETTPPPTPATIEVPRLVGLSASEARSRLRDLGLRATQRPIESTRRKGTVVAQSPRGGARLREGQAVTLTVSTGPALVSVPDVVGLDEQAARAELEAAGFEIEVVEEATDLVEEDGIVLAQEPAGGASRAKGAVVTITVGLFG